MRKINLKARDVLLRNASRTLSAIKKQSKTNFEIIDNILQEEKKNQLNAIKKDKSKRTIELIDKILTKSKSASTIPIRKKVHSLLNKNELKDEKLLKEIESLPSQLINHEKALKTLDKHPLIKPYIRTAKLYKVGEIANIPIKKIDRIVAIGITYKALGDNNLTALIKKKILTKNQANKLRYVSDLYRFVDEDIELTYSIIQSNDSKSKRINTLKGASKFTLHDWVKLITEAKILGHKKARDLAKRLHSKIEKKFPNHCFYHSLLRQHPQNISKSIKDVNFDQLLKSGFKFDRRNKQALAQKLTKIRGKKQRLLLEDIQKIINCYPGMGFENILNDSEISKKDKETIIERRVNQLHTFIERNIEQAFLFLDYSASVDGVNNNWEKLDFKGIDDSLKRQILKTLKCFQRVYAVCNEVDLSFLLIQNGFHSAPDISDVGMHQFGKIVGTTKLRSEQIINRSRWIINSVAAAMGAVIDIAFGGFLNTGASNISPAISDYLRSFEGYQDLFGDHDYCNCTDCQSILSPAAYFFDLLNFIETKILNNATVGEDHDLHLKSRRPDLWKLPLTCANTDRLVSSLTNSNEILENFIAVNEGFDPNNLYDPANDDLYSQGRQTIENYVYNILRSLENNIDQPFLLPLAEINTYFDHFKTSVSRFEIAEAIGVPREELIKTYFRTSEENLNLITSVKPLTFLETIYDYDFTATSGIINPVDAQVFLKALNLSRENLGDLVSTNFVSPSSSNRVEIVADKRDPINDVQNNVEYVVGLTATNLDNTHRLVRLSKIVPWSLRELDVLIICLESMSLINGISGDWTDAGGTHPGLLYYLMILQQISEEYYATCEELITLIGNFNITSTSSKNSLFDQLFNVTQYVDLDGEYPKPTENFVHPDFNNAAVSSPDDCTHQRLTSGLKIESEELFLLINRLGSPLALDANNGFLLTVENITLLYRHMLAAKWFGVSIDELFELIRICESMSNDYINGVIDFMGLNTFYSWLQSDFKNVIAKTENVIAVYDAVVNKDLTGLDDYYQPDLLVDSIVQKIEADKPFLFADTELSNINELNISLSDSQDIISSNPGIFIPNNGLYELSNNYSFAVIVFPPSYAYTPPQLAAIEDHLSNYHISTIIPRYLANELTIDVESIVEIIRFTDEDYTNPNLVDELKGVNATNDFLALINNIMPWALLIGKESVSPELISFIYDNPAPILFDLNDATGTPEYDSISYSRLRTLVIYKSFFLNNNSDYTDNDLIRLLSNFTSGNKFHTSGTPNDLSILGSVIGKEIPMTSFLMSILENNSIQALSQLDKLNQISCILSTSVEQLSLLISSDSDELRSGSLAVINAFRNKYSNEEEYLEKIEPFINKINELKRDALVSYITHNTDLEFNNINELYAHFLIDVEMGGCAKTSRVVSVISSLQLYVHRCLLCLEIDRDNNVLVEVEDNVREEWIWRKNFRVWQANRKVFLYPENYTEPDLRHNKSPLFMELEEELLQAEINDQNVLDAYLKYIKGFEEISNLKIVGAYNDSNIAGDEYKIYFIGATDSDPVQYYFRSAERINNIDRMIWMPWKKIDIEVPVKKVSPVIFNDRLYILWVELKTHSQNDLDGGTSMFIGYRHKMILKFTYLRIDGTWSSPQQVSLENSTITGPSDTDPFESIFNPGTNGEILDDLINPPSNMTPEYGDIQHDKPKDGYTLRGFHWEQVFPDITPGGTGGLRLSFAAANWNLWHTINFMDLSIRPISEGFDYTIADSVFAGPEFFTYMLSPTSPPKKTLVLRKSGENITYHKREFLLVEDRKVKSEDHWNNDIDGISVNEVVSGQSLEIFFDSNLLEEEPQFHAVNGMQTGVVIQTEYGSYWLKPSSGDTYQIERLNTTSVRQISSLIFSGGVPNLLNKENQDLEEIVPISNYPPQPILNNNISTSLDYTGAMGVYFREIYFHIPFLIANHLNSQRKFADAQRWYHYIFDPTSNPLFDPGDTAEIREEKLRERMWRYLEFNGRDIPTLRNILTDFSQIETYKKNPFNPHAIANLRLSAYQKTIVMKYIDNLIDWGDYLFNQDNMESINEATQLYIMASDLLGEKPQELGTCEAGDLNPKNYESIKDDGLIRSEFLLELENLIISLGLDNSTDDGGSAGEAEAPGNSVIRQVPIFCIPGNKKLLDYWEKVENRLGKIRNCMNISGIRRQMSLFAPEIDPAILVRAVAEGLSLEDVISSFSSNMPPYRFSFLLNVAKNQVAALQQFGNTLLSTLEKKDTEELSKLRVVHEKNALALSKMINDKEIESARDNIYSLEERRKVTQFRIGHFSNLKSNGVNKYESTQRKAQKASFELRSRSQEMGMMASVGHLMPQLGAPTAITFGGIQVGGSFSAFAGYYGYKASEKDFEAASAGLEAGFARREEDWEFQLNLAEKELSQIDKDIEVAKIRVEIAEQNKAVYQRNVEQNQEVLDYYQDKFTSLGLYTFLAKTVQNIYRTSYNLTLSLAKQTEQAYHFENNDNEIYIKSNYWDSSHAGMMAGEKLSLDLQSLENQFINNDFRKLEISQSFSLLRLSPDSMLDLKINGECDFDIPDIYFDLFYPGQYRRRIKSVQLTIPCITGPYTNVSADLSLVNSKIRNEPDGDLVKVPKSHTAKIATSSAQSDSGQFQLNFNDAQYAPFEGAGAVSSWNLKLPKEFRQFDYKTISDVIITIQYTAEYDESLRTILESQDSTELKSIKSFLSDPNTSLFRLLNFKYDFVNEFHKLMSSSQSTNVNISITENFFPLFFNHSNIAIESVVFVLETSKGQSITNFGIDINGTMVSDTSLTTAERHELDLSAAFAANFFGDHTLSIVNFGDLVNPENGCLHPAKLLNFYLMVEYRMNNSMSRVIFGSV